MTLLWRKVLECSSSYCSLRHPCVLTLMEEVSGVFFLTLLTSSSLCPHSLRHPCVLTPMTCLLTHLIVIPVILLLWRKVLECSSSHCSLRYPCVLTLMEEVSGVFFLTLLTSSSLWSHSLRYPCDLTPMEEGSGVFFLTAHFVIPMSSLTSSSLCSHTHDLSSHPSHRYPWLLSRVISPKSSLTTHSHITRVTTHPILSVLTHTHTHCTHQVISSSSLATHSHHLCYHAHSSPRSLSPHFSECSHPSLVFSHSPSHIECHHTHSHILLTCVTTLSDLTSLVFWESVCSHFHGVVLPPSLPTHCSERTCAPTHTPIYHVLTHSAPLTSFHLILATNASQMHHKCITNHLPHSPTHHASITSSSPHHLFLSPTTTNRFLSLHTTLLTPPFHSQPSQSSPKSSPISIHTHNDNSRTP